MESMQIMGTIESGARRTHFAFEFKNVSTLLVLNEPKQKIYYGCYLIFLTSVRGVLSKP